MTTSSVSSASCGNISGGACSEQIELMQQRHPGARSTDLECSAPVCDRRSGQGTVVITMPDGAHVNDTFGYVGIPAAVPLPACANVPPIVCGDVARQHVEDSVPPSQRVVAVQVVCTAAAGCTADEGSASISFTLGNGVTQSTEQSWSGGPP